MVGRIFFGKFKFKCKFRFKSKCRLHLDLNLNLHLTPFLTIFYQSPITCLVQQCRYFFTFANKLVDGGRSAKNKKLL